MTQTKWIRHFIAQLSFALLVASATAFAQKEMSIAEVQGDKAKSPVENQLVKVRGVVTAITRNSIFIQTPDDKVDGNPATSEGLLVFLGQRSAFAGSVG